MSELLKVENLETSFFTKAGTVKAVDSVSFSVEKGRTLGLVGESGCGKTVTSFSILGLLSPPGKVTAGRVLFEGQNLLDLKAEEMRKIRGRRISMIFQEPMTALNPVMRLGAQIYEQLRTHEQNLNKDDARHRAIELLQLVGIPSPERRLSNYPHELSGGMRQRAMIAMALSCKPALLIADEPTTALDVTIQAQILALLQTLQEELGMSMQFITHDLGVISQIAHDVVVMYAGVIVEKAPNEVIFSQPKHPYTVGLIHSIPKMGQTKEKLHTIEGNVPSLFNLPRGCRFQDRCPNVIASCRESEPPLTEITSGHSFACFNPM